MTRLFREVEIVEGGTAEPVTYVGIYVWGNVCAGEIAPPQLGFVEVDYTTEDVEKLRQTVKELEGLLNTLRMAMPGS